MIPDQFDYEEQALLLHNLSLENKKLKKIQAETGKKMKKQQQTLKEKNKLIKSYQEQETYLLARLKKSESLVSAAISDERVRQDKLWGKQRHPYPVWLTILVEEVGEVAQAIQKSNSWGKSTDANDLYKELIHVAAVASSAAEQVKEEQEA